MEDIRMQFHQATVIVYESADRETGYDAACSFQMVSKQGGVATPDQLLQSWHVSDGCTALWERRRLDLAVEAVLLQPEDDSLFSDGERDIVRERLHDFGSDR